MENLLNNDRYEILKEIDSGSYGLIFLAEDRDNKNKVAIKRIDKMILKSSDYLKKALEKEIEIMLSINCENSVLLIDYFQTKNYVYIVMELCDGNLESELISRTNPFSEEEFKQILNQLRNVFIIMDNKKICIEILS